MWEGDTEPLESGNWDLIAPSPIPYRPDSQIPKEMTREDMDLVRRPNTSRPRFGGTEQDSTCSNCISPMAISCRAS